jgi:pimeloyl-ACP methyl ester carboxylesterase
MGISQRIEGAPTVSTDRPASPAMHRTLTRRLGDMEGRLAYDLTGEVTGEEPLVVASPGLGDLRSTYRFLTPALVAAGHRVATMDLRGHGGSSTGWPSYTEEDVAGDMLALVAELGGGPAVLVGNSYSGGAAVVAAARRPDLVRGLVLSGPFVREVPMSAVQRLSMWVVGRTPFGRAVWGSYVPSLSPGDKPADFADRLAELRANLAEPGRWTAVAAMTRAGHRAAEEALGAVRAPTLVVMGEDDPDFPDPAAEARLTADLLGGSADVLLVPGTGHYPHVQRPDLVNPAVVAFLAGLPGSATAPGSRA